MGFFSKLVKGDWSNPFDNVKSGVKNITENSWNKLGPAMPALAAAGVASGVGMGIPWSSLKAGAKFAAPIALDWYQTNSANDAAAKLAREQMQFQERMSNTSYQRAMSDMQAAGLNPQLAYQQGGASTPQGASAGVQKAQTFDKLQAAMNGQSARQLQRAQSEGQLAGAEASRAQSAKATAELGKVAADIAESYSRTNLNDASREQLKVVAKQIEATIQNLLSQAESNSATTARTRVETQLRTMDLDSYETRMIMDALGPLGGLLKGLIPGGGDRPGRGRIPPLRAPR